MSVFVSVQSLWSICVVILVCTHCQTVQKTELSSNNNKQSKNDYLTIVHGNQNRNISNQEDPYPDFLDQSATIISTNEKPGHRFMPTIGNGHVATVVQSDTIFINGGFNGYNVTSHRARIPSTCAINISGLASDTFSSSYSLDSGRGMYTERHSLIGGSYSIVTKTYAHQELNRLLVTDIIVTNKQKEPVVLNLTLNSGEPSDDIDFDNISTTDWRIYAGSINKPEYDDHQEMNIIHASTHVPDSINVSAGVYKYTFFTFIDFSNNTDDVIDYLNSALTYLFDGTLERRHTNAWTQRWREGRIDVEGNTDLARVNYASLYYLMSSLPTKDSNEHFYGLSPGGLAHGAFKKDYQGHLFWDQETWMFPPILMLHVDLGEQILQSRMRHHESAKKYASMRGYRGAMFTWEAAYSGLDVCPAAVYSDYEQHITGDIAFAIKQYIMMTKDKTFLQNGGADLIEDIAEFWTSRVSFNSTKQMYEIYDVMPPDEYHQDVNNSVYTNTVAKISLLLPKYAFPLIKRNVPMKYEEMTKQLYIPFNKTGKWHPEFDNYTEGTIVKQADVVLLSYPLMQNYSQEVRKNDLAIYERVTPGGPAMTWGMFAVGWLELKEKDKAEKMFTKQFLNINEPFKVWTEVPNGGGAMNFLTGIGGYLQSLMFGYGGLRIHPDRLELNPELPPNTTGLNITGIDYLGGSLDFAFTNNTMVISLTKNATDVLQVVISSTGESRDLVIGQSVTFASQRVAIKLSKNSMLSSTTIQTAGHAMCYVGSLALVLLMLVLYVSM